MGAPRKIQSLTTTSKLQLPVVRVIILQSLGVLNVAAFSKEQDALGSALCWCRERAWHSSYGEKRVVWGVAVQALSVKAQATALQLFQTQST